MPSDCRRWAVAGPLDVPRILAFYLAFYLGSIPYVLGAAAMMPIDDRAFRSVVRGWSAFHRACARVLLGQKVRIDGALATRPVLYALRHESFFEGEAFQLGQIGAGSHRGISHVDNHLFDFRS